MLRIMLNLFTILLLGASVGLAQEEAEMPKTLREHIEAELASTNTALAEAKVKKSYQEAADAKNQKDALTVTLKHVDYLTLSLTQAEAKHDFDTCAKIDAEMKAVPHTTAGLTSFYHIAVQEEAKRDIQEAANKVVDKAGNTGLHAAVKMDDVVSARKLIAEGADPNRINDDAMTPLMLAARKGRVEVAKLLIEAGALKTMLDTGRRSALMWAAEENNLDVASLLVDEGASKDATDNRVGWRAALMWAAEEGHAEVAKMLVDAGCGK